MPRPDDVSNTRLGPTATTARSAPVSPVGDVFDGGWWTVGSLVGGVVVVGGVLVPGVGIGGPTWAGIDRDLLRARADVAGRVWHRHRRRVNARRQRARGDVPRSVGLHQRGHRLAGDHHRQSCRRSRPLEPIKVGVESLVVNARATRDRDGRSDRVDRQRLCTTVRVFPAGSVTETETGWLPSAPNGAVAVHEPFGWTRSRTTGPTR